MFASTETCVKLFYQIYILDLVFDYFTCRVILSTLTEKDNYIERLNLEKGIKGLCRPWTRETIIKIKKYAELTSEHITVEAREVIFEPDFSHTFVKVTTSDGKSLFLDGTGVGKHDSFFGPEDEAPKHLQNSTYDMMNYYLE